MKKIVIKVQSISDIITNSSSEVFVVKSDNTIKEVKKLIMEYDTAHEYNGDWAKLHDMPWDELQKFNTCSGDGGGRDH